MTISEITEQIIRESSVAISGVSFYSMQMWEADERFNEFTFPCVLLERVRVMDGSVGQNGFDTNKCTMLLYIFTGIIQLNGYVEEKGPLVLAAETIKESLIKNIRNHSLTHIEGDLPYHSEEIMESPLFTHNPCGVWVRITVPIRKRVC